MNTLGQLERLWEIPGGRAAAFERAGDRAACSPTGWRSWTAARDE